MNHSLQDNAELPIHLIRMIDEKCDDFESNLASGTNPVIEEFLDGLSHDEKGVLLRELLAVELQHHIDSNESIDRQKYLDRFADHESIVQSVLAGLPRPDETVSPSRTNIANSANLIGDDDELPESIGRYQVQKTLGKGGFGIVYLAHDEELDRKVAIKVPRASIGWNDEQIQLFKSEARIIGSLDHPNIVPAFDVDQLDDGRCFVVHKFIEGDSLADLVKVEALGYNEAAQVVATIGSALHYAHRKKLVHRDIKPANILIDMEGNPHLADFGLALTEESYGKFGASAGTPVYMSPEQVRGEGHLVDGRSDIFSLGVVFYELLTSERPFVGESFLDIADRITRVDPRPPRQLDESIPPELERICFRMLEKAPANRYSNAKDLVDDLNHFLSSNEPAATDDSEFFECIPKGLRSFESNDANFFCHLVAGPKDRHGIAESIRFWTRKIEDPQDDCFRIGLLYGPSGCGKSSFIRAGVLPQLSRNVKTIVINATPDETEAELRRRLSQFEYESEDSGVPILSGIRKQFENGTDKLLVVLDQFEQWLHVHPNPEDSWLVRELRQCDGNNLQCLLLVRDDFWSAVSRFMSALDMQLVEQQNSMMLDLFDQRHATRVLGWFGQAFGALPRNEQEISSEQNEFVKQAVELVTEENGRVICVKLALLAEMIKDKEWSLSTLKTLGGLHGVGILFLNDKFDSPDSPYEYRLMSEPIRRVLGHLLPTDLSSIKAPSISRKDLQNAANLVGRDKDFETILRILDLETRLVTPISSDQKSESDLYYQLTHDYLVPTIRKWLTQKQQETMQGRAELRLAERTDLWIGRQENRQLPSLWELLSIRALVKGAKTANQQKMLQAATKYYLQRFAIVVPAVVVLLFSVSMVAARFSDRGRVVAESFLNADLQDAEAALQGDFRSQEVSDEFQSPIALDYLRSIWDLSDDERKRRISLALLESDSSQMEFLWQQMRSCSASELGVIRRVLRTKIEQEKSTLIAELDNQNLKSSNRFRSACILAEVVDSENAIWKKNADLIAKELDQAVARDYDQSQSWVELFRPTADSIFDPLIALYRNKRQRQTLTLISRLFDHDVNAMIEVLAVAFPEDTNVVLHNIKFDSEGLLALKRSLEKRIQSKSPAAEIANLTMAEILQNDTSRLHYALGDSVSKDLSTFMIHQMPIQGVPVTLVVDELKKTQSALVRANLVMTLGGYQQDELEATISELTPWLLEKFQSDEDPGVHGAVDWLIRRWGMNDELISVANGLRVKEPDSHAQWFINESGFTMVAFGPVTFEIGRAEPTTGFRPLFEDLHQRRINRRFAISTMEVTAVQFQEYLEEFPAFGSEKFESESNEHPVKNVSWYRAAHFCNWLSKKEGIHDDDLCYEPAAKHPQDEFGYGRNMKIRKGALTKKGYRLPTESEWEFSVKGKINNDRYMGESKLYLNEYAWFDENSQLSLHPVGLLKPNRFGLFDMLGNCREWCHDPFTKYPPADKVTKDRDWEEVLSDSLRKRVLRGGNFVQNSRYIRNTVRDREVPGNLNLANGFRIARTLESFED